jgi:U4/U6.U5 tri-snRNP component SNU23
MLGQTTRIERSTVEQVREKIAQLRAQTKDAQTAKNFDFDRRLAEIKAKEDARRTERKTQKKAAKEAAREAERLKTTNEDVDMQSRDDIAAMMGFGGFGTSKK